MTNQINMNLFANHSMFNTNKANEINSIKESTVIESTSTGTTEKKEEISIKTIATSNTDHKVRSIFKQYRMSPDLSKGSNFHLYDISSISDQFQHPLKNNNIISYINGSGQQEFKVLMNHSGTDMDLSITFSIYGYSSEEPMDEVELKNNIIKTFKILDKNLSIKEKLGDKKLNQYGTCVIYNSENESIDFNDLKESLLSKYKKRANRTFPKDYNGNMNIMVDKMKLDKYTKEFEEFLFRIIDKSS